MHSNIKFVILMIFLTQILGQILPLNAKSVEEGVKPTQVSERKRMVCKDRLALNKTFDALELCYSIKWAPLPVLIFPATTGRACCYHLESLCVYNKVMRKFCETDDDFETQMLEMVREVVKDCSKSDIALNEQYCKQFKTNKVRNDICLQYLPCSLTDDVNEKPVVMAAEPAVLENNNFCADLPKSLNFIPILSFILFFITF